MLQPHRWLRALLRLRARRQQHRCDRPDLLQRRRRATAPRPRGLQARLDAMDADAHAAARRGPVAPSGDARAVYRASDRRRSVPAGHDRSLRDPGSEPAPSARGDRRAPRRADTRPLPPAAAAHRPSRAGPQLQPGPVRRDDRAHRRAGAADRRHLDDRGERSERRGDAEEGGGRSGRGRCHRPPPQPRMG